MSYKDDFTWQERFAPEVMHLIAIYICPRHIVIAPAEEDMKHNTDFMFFHVGGMNVAFRVRRPDQIQYRDEFTIRFSRPHGTKTEYRKIIEGFGDYIIYAFAAQDERSLQTFLIGDLNQFRSWNNWILGHHGALGITKYERRNGDGTTFLAIPIDDLPAAFVVARQPYDEPF